MDGNNTSFNLQAGFNLGPWTILPNQNRIEGEPDSVHLEPKVMEVLCVLARRQGEVVSRNELIEEVWKGTFVTDEVLSRAISVLRKQLGDDSKNPQYIATVPKAGYRLIREVKSIKREAKEPEIIEPLVSQPKHWFRPAGITALLLLIFAAGYLVSERKPETPVDPRSPTLFADLSDWFELIIRGDTAPEAVTNIAVLPFFVTAG